MTTRGGGVLLAWTLVAGCSSGGSSVADGGGDDDGPADPDAAGRADAAVDGEAATVGGPLRVMTYNVLHGFPRFEDVDARTDMLVRFLDAELPDVVLLQEIHQTGLMENRAAILAEATGYRGIL